MNLLIAGGSGFIGRNLSQALLREGHQVVVLSRNPAKAARGLPRGVKLVEWDGAVSDALLQAFEGMDGLVNLAGEPIADSRWSEARKGVLRSSRIGWTRSLVDAIAHLPHSNRPKVLINASGVGFYGSQESGSRVMGEQSPPGQGFLADLCVEWEEEAIRAEKLGVRVIRLRIGMVLGKDGGALPKMIVPFRLFLGGPISPGTQQVSWIHIEDLSRMVLWTVESQQVQGPVNAVAPEPVTMKTFCHCLGMALGRPSWVPIPAWVLQMALGELSTLMTTGHYVQPLVAQREGFTFRYPSLSGALDSLAGQSSSQ